MAGKTLVTKFRHADEAESAVFKLRQDGFPPEAVGWVTRGEGGREIPHGNLLRQEERSGRGRVPLAAALSGLLGLLLAVVALTGAGVLGPVRVVVSLVAAFVGVSLVAAFVGVAAGRRIDASMRAEVPLERANRYAGQLRTDAAVVMVTVNDEQEEARALDILRGEADLHRHPLVWRVPALSDEGRPSKPSLA